MWQHDAQEVCFHSSTSTGFHTEGALEFPPLPPTQEILKLSMVIIVLSQVLNNTLVPDCVRSNLRGSKFRRGGMPPDAPSRHSSLHVHEHAFAHYYHPAKILFPPPPPTPPPPPNSKSCMKPRSKCYMYNFSFLLSMLLLTIFHTAYHKSVSDMRQS